MVLSFIVLFYFRFSGFLVSSLFPFLAFWPSTICDNYDSMISNFSKTTLKTGTPEVPYIAKKNISQPAITSTHHALCSARDY